MVQETIIEQLNVKIQEAREKSKKFENPKINVWIDNLVGLTSENVKELKVEPNENVEFFIKNKDLWGDKCFHYNPHNGNFVGLNGLSKALKALEHVELNIDKTFSEIEKAVYIYDWLSFNCKHENKRSIEHDYEFMTGTKGGVCGNFASATTQLLLRQEIDAYTISTATHAFTIARINGKLYPIDADLTANDGLTVNGFAREGYYDMKGLHFDEFLEGQQIEKNYLPDETVWEITEKVMPEYNRKREELQNQLLNK